MTPQLNSAIRAVSIILLFYIIYGIRALIRYIEYKKARKLFDNPRYPLDSFASYYISDDFDAAAILIGIVIIGIGLITFVIWPTVK